MYLAIKKEMRTLLSDEKNFIANASNFSALIYQRIKSLNWVGFYFIDGDELILGPFQGKPACIRIKIGVGVCGTCAEKMKTILVHDVHQFSGHIACDARSNSEIVVPIIYKKKLYGVLDIDSPAFERFIDQDKMYFEELVQILIESSDIEALGKYYH
jgi:L-methionine (R)-S-oxide reductase